MLASTTSVDDSGLLDVLLPAFHAAHPDYKVKVVAVGSGEALALGLRGDADVLITHSPSAEQRFMAEGGGRTHATFMRNDFVLVGPPNDPAGARSAAVSRALLSVAAAGAPFISRGDDSGTHAREQTLWDAAGVDPSGASWYMSIGQGMGEALRVASERGGYTLTDRATYLSLMETLLLDILVAGDRGLTNEYSVITTTRGRNCDGADALAAWLRSEDGQALIGAFGAERFGRALFEPLLRRP